MKAEKKRGCACDVRGDAFMKVIGTILPVNTLFFFPFETVKKGRPLF